MGVTLYILIYVDDIILTGNNEALIQQVITSLSKKFSLKYLGLLHYQFNTSPSVVHWKAVKRILRYLKATSHYGILISPQQSTNLYLYAYADVDWAGDINDRRSISGYIVYLGTTPISWCSRKQPTVSRSSTKAEYRAVASALFETNWITHLLKDLHVPLSVAPTIFCDNLGVTYIAEIPVHHTKMKHLEVDLHFVRNQVRNGLVRVSHIHSTDQIADPLTKPLSKTTFQRMLPKLGVVPLRPT